ncbi:MAG: hypothetical protein K8R64_01115 [Methanosarcinaceae archaeon]|nr:hypothetical protein [Methanosarcinaceae archaeon]
MTEFERVLVRSFNNFFEKDNIKGIAHRLKQHRFTPQFLDVLVDSLDPDYYLGIECKSISVEKGANALYFTQHFTVDKKGAHQIDRISDFLRRSGRTGYLVVELRRGSGCTRKAHIIPWNELHQRFHTDGVLKYTVDEIQDYPEIQRNGEQYVIDPIKWRDGKRLLG